MLWIWGQFAICLLLIAFAGSRLSRYGDAIADKTGLGGTWVGVVMLATVTSLPELATGVSSVTVANVPSIAVGDVLGSCVFNLLIIVLLDFIKRGESVYRVASQGHILAAGFGIMLIGFIGFSLVIAGNGSIPAIGHVGFYTPILIVLYGVAMRTVFRYEKRALAEFAEAEEDQYPDLTLAQALLRYGLAGAVVVGAGVWLPFVAEQLAAAMGWTESFVGTLFVAFATSVPELVVTIAAMQIGALDMAIGNLFGSNLFNCLIIAIDDLFYTPGPLLEAVTPAHSVSALSALMMTGVAVVGLLYRPTSRVLKTVGWASIFLFLIYLLNSVMLFLYGV